MPGRANNEGHFLRVQRAIDGKKPGEQVIPPATVERLKQYAEAYSQTVPDSRVIDQFAAYLELSPRTVARYKSTLHEFLFYLDGTKKLDEAKRRDVIGFINWLSTNRVKRDRDGMYWEAPLSESSVKNAVAALRAFYAFLNYVDEERSYDPMQGVKTPKVVVKRGDTLTPEEVVALLEAPGTARDRIQCWMLAFTACRAEELRTLRWCDVDLKNGLMFITGKGQKPRTLDIHDRLAPELFKWRDQQKHEARSNPDMALALHSEATGYVFLTKNGKPLAPGAMWKALNRRAVRAGVRLKDVELDKRGRKKDNGSEVTCHMLRRTFATTLLRAGVQLDAVADVLGHASLDTTRRHYAFSSDERRKATVNAFKVA